MMTIEKKIKTFDSFSQVEALNKIIDWKSKQKQYREIKDIRFRIDPKKPNKWICEIEYE